MREPSTEKPSKAFLKAVKEQLFVPQRGQWTPAPLLSRKKGNSQTDELWLFDYVGETWEESARRFGIGRSDERVTGKNVPEGWYPERTEDILSREPTYDLEMDRKGLGTMPEGARCRWSQVKVYRASFFL